MIGNKTKLRCVLIAGGVNPNMVGGAPISILAWVKAMGADKYWLVCSKDSPRIKNGVSFASLGHISFNPLFMDFSIGSTVKNWIDAFKVLKYVAFNHLGLRKKKFHNTIKINHGHWYIGANIIVVRFLLKSYLQKLDEVGMAKNKLARFLDLKTRVLLWIEKLMFSSKKTSYIIALSHIGANEVKTMYHPSGDIRVIENGIDKDKFIFQPNVREKLRAKFGIKKKDICVLFPGGNMLRKNVKIFLAVANKNIQKNIHFFIVAKDSEKALLEKEHTLDKVSFLPWTSNFVDYLSFADIMIFPSIYDTGPKTVPEAIETGMYVITTANCGISEKMTLLHGHVVHNVCCVDEYISACQYFKKMVRLNKFKRRNVPSICKTWDEVLVEIKKLCTEIEGKMK